MKSSYGVKQDGLYWRTVINKLFKINLEIDE